MWMRILTRDPDKKRIMIRMLMRSLTRDLDKKKSHDPDVDEKPFTRDPDKKEP